MVRILISALAGVVGFVILGIAEISSRLHQGGVAQLVGPPRPSAGADATQIVTLLLVAVVVGLCALAVLPRLDRLSAAVLAGTLIILSITGWIVFTEPTFVAYGRSMELTVDRIAHAGSTCVGTFVLAGIALAHAVARRPATVEKEAS